MKVNMAALDLIKEFEGFRAKAYLDELAKPPVWTIGYGTTARAGVGIEPRAGMTISKADAEGYLMRSVEKFAAQIAPMLKKSVNENEFGAMVSLAYNIGPGAFGRSSVLRRFNAGDKAGAADAFRLWNKAGGKVWAGLVRRRDAERALFLRPVSITPTPSVAIPNRPVSGHVRKGEIMTLVNQPTAAPTRKWWALVLAGFVVNGAFGALDAFWPDHPFAPYKAEIIGWAVLAVSAVAAYMTKNRA
jgi:lysozyme